MRYLRTVPNQTTRPTGYFFACRDGESGISLFAREQELADDTQLERFQRACILPKRGDLPGLFHLEDDDLAEVGLSCARVVDPKHPFGHLHFETAACPSPDQAKRLALRAKNHGVALRFRAAPTVPDDL